MERETLLNIQATITKRYDGMNYTYIPIVESKFDIPMDYVHICEFDKSAYPDK